MIIYRFIEAIQSAITPVYNNTLQIGDKITDVFAKLQGLLSWRNAPAEILSVVSAGASSTADQIILTTSLTAGSYVAGEIVRVVAYGTITKPLSVGTSLIFWLKAGAAGTKVASVTYTPTAAQTTRPFKIEFDLIIRSISASGKLYAMGEARIQQVAGCLGIVQVGSELTLNTTVALPLTLGFNFTNSNASNNVTAQIARIGTW